MLNSQWVYARSQSSFARPCNDWSNRVQKWLPVKKKKMMMMVMWIVMWGHNSCRLGWHRMWQWCHDASIDFRFEFWFVTIAVIRQFLHRDCINAIDLLTWKKMCQWWMFDSLWVVPNTPHPALNYICDYPSDDGWHIPVDVFVSIVSSKQHTGLPSFVSAMTLVMVMRWLITQVSDQWYYRH